jgi:hypothetical protein
VGAEQLQRLVGAGLGRGHHLAELGEGDLHQRAGVGVDAVGEVGERRAARQAHDSPLPRATPPPIVGAARLSNS